MESSEKVANVKRHQPSDSVHAALFQTFRNVLRPKKMSLIAFWRNTRVPCPLLQSQVDKICFLSDVGILKRGLRREKRGFFFGKVKKDKSWRSAHFVDRPSCVLNRLARQRIANTCTCAGITLLDFADLGLDVKGITVSNTTKIESSFPNSD